MEHAPAPVSIQGLRYSLVEQSLEAKHACMHACVQACLGAAMALTSCSCAGATVLHASAALMARLLRRCGGHLCLLRIQVRRQGLLGLAAPGGESDLLLLLPSLLAVPMFNPRAMLWNDTQCLIACSTSSPALPAPYLSAVCMP